MKKCFSLFAVVALAAVALAGAAVAAAPVDVASHVLPMLASLANPDVALGLATIAVLGITTYVQDGETLTLTPGAAVSNGQGYLFGAALFGVATQDVANGVPGEFRCEGVVTIAKTSALAIAVGDRLFWDATNKCVNKTTAAQQQVGIAVAVAANPSATVQMLLESAVPVAT